MKTLVNKKIFLFLLLVIFLITYSGAFSQNIGSNAYIHINKIYLPFDNKGNIAQVNIQPFGSGGHFANEMFVFSSGFWLSGYSDNYLWANGVATASLVEDYQPGTVGMDPNNPKAKIYKVTSSDVPFGQSWQDWIDAVSLGADFYDGDGDGIYNPVDKNNNGIWDPDEDKPDLLLDETYWCVFNDGQPANQRRWEATPQGIEIKQTIFASSSSGALENVVFVRYKIKNTGLIADTLKEVYFSMQADADVGDPSDDLFGCDTVRQAVYYYNKDTDQAYGNQVPAFMMDMLASPYSYIPGVTFIDVNGNIIYDNGIDTPLDTAYNYMGPLGINVFPGAKNLLLNSAVYQYNGAPVVREPANINEVRNYIFGLIGNGTNANPCSFSFGHVVGVPCNQVNPYFWFSGDPANNTGWIDTIGGNIRGNGTTGPFTLIKDQEMVILVGYEIDSSTTPLGGITAVRAISDAVQNFYENNFGYSVVSVKDEQPVVSGFKLKQNYPNPFNPTTTIIFVIPNVGTGLAQSYVTLKVYDVLGNEVATLVNEEKQHGNYEIEFNVAQVSRPELASGIYFYQLRAGSYVETKKMVLMK